MSGPRLTRSLQSPPEAHSLLQTGDAKETSGDEGKAQTTETPRRLRGTLSAWHPDRACLSATCPGQLPNSCGGDLEHL